MTELFEPTDAHDRRLATAPGPAPTLAALNRAGLLHASDLAVARRVAALAGDADDHVLVAAALVVRATRQGSVCVDLDADLAAELVRAPAPGQDAPVSDAVAAVAALLPTGSELATALAPSELVRQGVLRLDGSRLYLDRYWQDEGSVVADVRARLTRGSSRLDLDPDELERSLVELFPGPGYDEQRDAARRCAERGTSVLTGGPGTGKTATLARLLAVLARAVRRTDGAPFRVALAAPTGKAAARMNQAIAEELARPGFAPGDQALLGDMQAMTLHRLLGRRPDNSTRFRRHRGDPLTHDVVVVDESSMISLTMMARLLEALRPDTVLVLVGDPRQLASVEAGAVLDNLVEGLESSGSPVVARLTRNRRFSDDSRIARLARAVNAGRDDEAWAVLTEPGDELVRLDPDETADTASLRTQVEDAATGLAAAAAASAVAADGSADRGLLAALGAHRVLCAHREGPYGVTHWNGLVEQWLKERAGVDWLPRSYAGQPLLVTVNDYSSKLWNGDTAVVVAPPDGRLVAVVDDGGDGRRIPLTRLPETQTAHAMTVHRSQGSQFRSVTVVLPDVTSGLLTRELVYTAVTRATHQVRVVTSEEAFRVAVRHRARRATGLRERLAEALVVP